MEGRINLNQECLAASWRGNELRVEGTEMRSEIAQDDVHPDELLNRSKGLRAYSEDVDEQEINARKRQLAGGEMH